MISTSPPREALWGNGADWVLNRLREGNSICQGTGDPLLHEGIRHTVWLLQSLSPSKDWSAAGVKRDCCSSMINSHLPRDWRRDLMSLGAVDAFCRIQPQRTGVWRMSAALSETQGWNCAWWERAAALWERNARGRGCTQRRVEEECVRQQLWIQAGGRQ